MVKLHELISDVWIKHIEFRHELNAFSTKQATASLGAQQILGNPQGHRGAVKTMEATSEGANVMPMTPLFWGNERCCWSFWRSGLGGGSNEMDHSPSTPRECRRNTPSTPSEWVSLSKSTILSNYAIYSWISHGIPNYWDPKNMFPFLLEMEDKSLIFRFFRAGVGGKNMLKERCCFNPYSELHRWWIFRWDASCFL